jgi:amino acid transporter
MNRTISGTTLLFASVSAILGSGWLFSSYYTSLLAGPAAILAWVVGGLALIIVAFVYAELTSMLPITGSSTRIPHYTHGTIVSFMFAWMIWLSYASLVATEVQAIIQYLSYYFPSLIHASGALTEKGYLCATVMMLAISAINIFSLRWLMRCNNIFTAMKIIIPIIVCALIGIRFFSIKHIIYPGHSSFMPYGWHGIFSAISTGGIVFAFNGFKQACEMAGEAKNPTKTVPFAILGSILLTLIIYLLLQVTFLSSLTPHNLIHGFKHLHLLHANSPLAAILGQDNLTSLNVLLYIGAIIGPFAAGLMYMGSASRTLYGKSKNGYLPELFQMITPQGNPFFAIIVTFAFGMFIFAPLPGWNNLVSFLTSLMAITYGIAPVCLLTLRKQAPNQPRPFKLPYSTAWANLAFFICNSMTYFSGWKIISKLTIALLLGLVILFSYHFGSKRGKKITFYWKASTWIWPYFLGLYIISYLGNFGGGRNIIPFGWDFVIIAIFSYIIMKIAVNFRLEDKKTLDFIKDLQLNKNNKEIK